MSIVPARSELVPNILDELPIRLTTLEWFQHLIEPLDASLGTGECPFFFQARCSRQHTIGVSARVPEKDVLYDKEVELAECGADMVSVGIDDTHFLADDIQRFELAGVNRFHHLVVVQSLGGRKRYLPCVGESQPNFRIIDRLISR